MKKLISFVSIFLFCFQITNAQRLQQVLPAEVGFDEVRLQNADKAISTVAKFDAKSGKTKDAIKELKIESSKNYLVVVPEKTESILRATNNIANVKVVRPTYLNVFDILNADQIIIVESALAAIENWLIGKENA